MMLYGFGRRQKQDEVTAPHNVKRKRLWLRVVGTIFTILFLAAIALVVMGIFYDSPIEEFFDDSIERVAGGEKLLLIEQLTYLDEDVADAAGVGYVSADESSRISDFLENYTDEALDRLERAGDIIDKYGINTNMQGNEWAAVIRRIKADEEIMDLKITDCDIHEGRVRAMCLHDSFFSDNAIVAFRGTSSADEWIDNAAGFNKADTDGQIAALEYIEGLKYDNIYVVGHSKGGNKAQYVTVRSDKVKYCVSMDGQGFSPEFFEKYEDEVRKKGSQITCYSLFNDYIHQLMFAVPGSQQLYCKGGGIKNYNERHSPNSFFHYEKEPDRESVSDSSSDAESSSGSVIPPSQSPAGKRRLPGRTYIKTDDAGNAQIVFRDEGRGISLLHGFSCYILNVMPDADKEPFAEYLRKIIAIKYGGLSIRYKNRTYSENNMLDFVVRDNDNFSLLVSYLISYVNAYNVSDSEVFEMLRALNCEEIVTSIRSVLKNDLTRMMKDVIWRKMSEALLDDGEDVYWSRILSSVIAGFSAETDGERLWRGIEAAYKRIPVAGIDLSKANKDYAYRK